MLGDDTNDASPVLCCAGVSRSGQMVKPLNVTQARRLSKYVIKLFLEENSGRSYI